MAVENGVATGASNVKMSTTYLALVPGEQELVEWSPATVKTSVPEGTEVEYKIQVLRESDWEDVEDAIVDTNYIYTIPNVSADKGTIIIRILSRTKDSGAEYELFGKEVSPVYTIHNSLFLVRANDKLYTFELGSWVEVPDEKNSYLTRGLFNLTQVPQSKWEQLEGTLSIVSYSGCDIPPQMDIETPPVSHLTMLRNIVKGQPIHIKSYVEVRRPLTFNMFAVPKRQLVFPNEDIKLSSPTIPNTVNEILLSTNMSENTVMKIMFSSDGGLHYKSWNGTAWDTYTDVIDDEATKDLIEQKGMTVEVLNSLTREQLELIFGNQPGHRTIRLVYLYDKSESGDTLESSELKIMMDVNGSWRQAKEEDYFYGYPTNEELHLHILKSGSYKINGLLTGDEINRMGGE